MILINQKRDTAFNFDTVLDITLDETVINATVGYEERRPLKSRLGEYSSTARAKEVFKDLCLQLGRIETTPIGIISLAED